MGPKASVSVRVEVDWAIVGVWDRARPYRGFVGVRESRVLVGPSREHGVAKEVGEVDKARALLRAPAVAVTEAGQRKLALVTDEPKASPEGLPAIFLIILTKCCGSISTAPALRCSCVFRLAGAGKGQCQILGVSTIIN